MQHGWILAGERGIGRATLAFRLARFVLARPDPRSPEVAAAEDLFVPAEHPVARRLALGVQADVLHLQRDWIDRQKRFRTDVSVDSIRRITPFLGTTASGGGWRVVIVDPADDMNRSSANAILKNLEEPPGKTLFLLVARSRGALLPTIVSRCRTLALAPLSPGDTQAVVREIAPDDAGETGGEVAALAGGSPRRLIELVRGNGVELYRLMLRAIEEGDGEAQMQLAARSADAEGMRQLIELFEGYLTRRVRGLPEPGGTARPPAPPLVRFAELWEKAALSGQEVEEYNLDRRQFVLDLLERSASALRSGSPSRPQFTGP
jgi:DNA polymerase-3 subunit delta'